MDKIAETKMTKINLMVSPSPRGFMGIASPDTKLPTRRLSLTSNETPYKNKLVKLQLIKNKINCQLNVG